MANNFHRLQNLFQAMYSTTSKNTCVLPNAVEFTQFVSNLMKTKFSFGTHSNQSLGSQVISYLALFHIHVMNQGELL